MTQTVKTPAGEPAAARASATSRGGPLSPAERRAYELGRRCLERGDREGALGAYRELLRTRDGFADVHYRVATLLEETGDLEGAREHLRAALSQNPAYIEALLALASLFERQGDFDRSSLLTERARELAGPARGALDPTTRAKLANMQAELGDAYREAGELREAISAYRKALDRCPHFHDVRHRLGVALREAGRPDAALDEFRRVLRGNPEFWEAAVQRGVTLYGLGRSREAVTQWQSVLRDAPDREDARMYLRLLGASDAERS